MGQVVYYLDKIMKLTIMGWIMNQSNTTTKKLTMYQSLMERRVPQISGFYLGGSWGIIQFVEWIVERYGLSPYLPDFSLVVLFSLLPSVFLVAYFHGRPGDDDWNRVEKISIPINMMITAALLMTFFSGKDLGAATETIIVQNEAGETIRKVVAKSAFRKKIAIFNIKNNSGDETLDWIEGGFPMLLQLDLMQDPFINEVSLLLDSGGMYKKLKKAGFADSTNAPIGLLSKITRERHFQYFLKGNLKKVTSGFQLDLSLYNARVGKKIVTNTIKAKSIFELVDAVSILVKENLDIPKYHLESIQDLPVEELSSSNEEALRLFVKSLEEMSFHNNFQKGAEQAEKAVVLDPSFAMAHLYLGVMNANSNKSKESLESIKLAMKYDYKLSDYFKFTVKDMFYVMSGKSKKRLNLIKMQVSLEPDNIDLRLRLANIYSASKKHKKAIEEMERIMLVAPQPKIYLDDIGFLYLQLNQLNDAEECFLNYAKEFPSEPQSFNNLAFLYNLQGKDNLVHENYEKSLFLDPENLQAILSLAAVDEKSGLFDKSFIQYQTALSTFVEPIERARIYNRLVNYYRILGRPKNALEAVKLLSIEIKKARAPLNALISDLMMVTNYIDAGEVKAGFDLLESVEKQLQPPFDQIPALGYSLAYVSLEKPEKAMEYIIKLETALNALDSAAAGLTYFPVKMRAQVAEMNKDYQLALQRFQEYADNSPLDVTRFGDLGRVYRKLNENDSALETLTKQLKSTPFYPETNHQLGLLYLAMEDNENAIKHFQRAADVWKNAEEGFEEAKINAMELEKLIE